MPTLFILIPEAALRDAITEQIAVAHLGNPIIADSPAAFLPMIENVTSGVALIDASVFDARLAGEVASMPAKSKDIDILLLGHTETQDGIRESFAKPFRLGHLITRLTYYLQTAPLLRDRVLGFGPYRLETHSRRLLRDGGEAQILTEKETALLVYLNDRSEPASRKEILAHIWGYDERIDTHTLETHIYHLRRKIDRDGENWLVNENGAYHLAMGMS